MAAFNELFCNSTDKLVHFIVSSLQSSHKGRDTFLETFHPFISTFDPFLSTFGQLRMSPQALWHTANMHELLV